MASPAVAPPHPMLPEPQRKYSKTKPISPFKRWLLEGFLPEEKPSPDGEGDAADREAPYVSKHVHQTRPWYKVLCLTGVDYFSTLGYQPGIAAIAAGPLSPLATLVLILLTLFGAVPVYQRVAQESPHGEGSISMLEHLLLWWKGKLFVLALLGFAATDFIITITLSAADAAAHVTENSWIHHNVPALHGQEIIITLFLVVLLGAVFLKGFKEAIGIAVVLVGLYLTLNAVVITVGIAHLMDRPEVFHEWRMRLTESYGLNPFMLLAYSMLLFPKLALGLSGFETGVAVMPLIKGEEGDTEENPKGRIRNTRKLLITAAVLMSVYLIASSIVTTFLIPPDAFKPGGPANGRALAFLAHRYLGEGFGSFYDASTISILWFAGASAMAGLLNLVPRYLPRYGMAPEWTRATRPLTLLFTALAIAITIIFKANVDAQGGAYATGVLFLMTSAAVAVTISAARLGQKLKAVGFGVVALVFAYTTVANIIERPDGIKIAALFIGAIVFLSFLSRIWRLLELRVDRVDLDETARRFLREVAVDSLPVNIIANDPDKRNAAEYAVKENHTRREHRIPESEPVLFFEAYVTDPSSFSHVLTVKGIEIGHHRILQAQGTAIPNSIAAFLLYARDETKKVPRAYFDWTEGSPLGFVLRYLLLGVGDTGPVTHEILRRAEPDPNRRPIISIE